MPSIEGLEASNTQLQGNADTLRRQQAASEAADLFKQGDIKGAFSTMARVDPEHVGQLLTQFQQFDPATQGAISQSDETGKLNAQKALGSSSIPVKTAQIGADSRIAAALAKFNQQQSKEDDKLVHYIDGQGNVVFAKQGDIKNQIDPGNNSAQPEVKAKPAPVKTYTPPNQGIQDTGVDGKPVTITKTQLKMIDKIRSSFDSETKDLVKAIEAADTAKTLTEANNAGGEPLERLRLLRTVSPRPSQQEFQAFGTSMGALDNLENSLQKIGNGKMTPEIQKDYLNIINLMASKLSSEYDARLKNTLARNPDIDSLVLKKRLVGEGGPTSYQQIVQKVSTLPPEAQALFNWAHDNPSDPRSAHYLKQLNDKYKLGQ